MIVMVFATSSLVNANSSVEDEYLNMNCHNFAEIAQGMAMMNGFSYGASLSIWEAAYDGCIFYQIDNLVELEEEEYSYSKVL